MDNLDKVEAADLALDEQSSAEEKQYVDQLRDTIRMMLPYTWPEKKRGPAWEGWILMMREVAQVLEWEICPKCEGTGGGKRDICTRCFAIGRIYNEE